VDSTKIQIYDLNGNKVKVINDRAFGVSIESEIDILKYFNLNY